MLNRNAAYSRKPTRRNNRNARGLSQIELMFGMILISVGPMALANAMALLATIFLAHFSAVQAVRAAASAVDSTTGAPTVAAAQNAATNVFNSFPPSPTSSLVLSQCQLLFAPMGNQGSPVADIPDSALPNYFFEAQSTATFTPIPIAGFSFNPITFTRKFRGAALSIQSGLTYTPPANNPNSEAPGTPPQGPLQLN